MLGQPAGQPVPHRIDLHLAHDVGDEALLSRTALVHGHGRAGHLGEFGHRRFDLTRLDPETADLHLVVGSAREFDEPVGIAPGQVPGSVHALALGEGGGDEPLCRQAGPAQVPAGELDAGHVELAHLTESHGP